jgi:hypothetical protein
MKSGPHKNKTDQYKSYQHLKSIKLVIPAVHAGMTICLDIYTFGIQGKIAILAKEWL